MAGCNDDIILRKDNVICDKGSGISLKDFVNKLIAEYMASNPSTGGGSGGSGGGTTTGTTSITLIGNDESGVAAESKTINLPNGTPLKFDASGTGYIFKVTDNTVQLKTPESPCSKSISTPTLSLSGAVGNTTLINTNLTNITLTIVYAFPPGDINTTTSYPPCPSKVNTSFQSNSFTITFTDTFSETLEYSLSDTYTSPASSFTFSTNSGDANYWASGTTKVFYLRQTNGNSLNSTSTSSQITITASATGVKSDNTTTSLTSNRNVKYSTYNIYSGYSATAPEDITSNNIASGNTFVNDVKSTFAFSNKNYNAETFSPTRYFYFIAPDALFTTDGLTTFAYGATNTQFGLKSDTSGTYTNSDSYGTGGVAKYKTLTLHNVTYRVYVSQNAFGSSSNFNPFNIN